MKELINITTNPHGEEVVSARELHDFLESKQEFANWIKTRIKKYGFVENQDYTTFDNFVKRENSNLKSKTIEYAITIDMAKELSMVEGNEKGKAARRYFISIEKAAKSMWLIIEEKLDVMQKQIERLFSVKSYHQEQIAALRIKTRYAQLAYKHPDYMSLSEYAEKIGETCPTKQRSAIARELKERSKTKGYEVLHRPTIGDSKINLYHIDVMKDFFAIAGKKRQL